MKKVAVYPGTFDPITFGHIDVIKKALKLFGKIVVGVSDVSNKNYLFNSEERINIVNKALFKDLNLDKKKITVVTFSSLTTDLCKKYKSNIINMKIACLIPARGGSKGIPKKNIIDFNGKPLISYSIEQAKMSKYIDKIFRKYCKLSVFNKRPI